MKFIVKCDTFRRLASITDFFAITTHEETREQLRCVRLENYNGQSYAIASNQKICAIEYLGKTTEPNGVAHVKTDTVLVDQCKTESAYDSFLEIVTVPEIALASAQTMMGFVYQGNPCFFPDETLLDDWQNWCPDKPATKNKGALYMTVDYTHSLVLSSPSGSVTFPEFIDTERPVILRDTENPNWVGLFMGKNVLPNKPATLPEWWKK